MRRFLTVAFLSLAAPLAAWGQEQPVQLPAREQVHIYLLMGQSNMAGRGVVEEQDKIPHPRVIMFTKDQTWAPATDPLHFDKPTIAGVGLGSAFGRAMAEAQPDVTIALVPCAVGGTPLSRWQKDGDLYQQALARAQAAGKDGVFKGVLWHQGEGDSGRESTARSYGERLAKMIQDLRSDLGVSDLPVVVGELGRFLKRENRDGSSSFWPVVNEQLGALPSRVAKTAVVSSEGLNAKSDEVHFDSASLREFGKRYAAAMQKLQ